MIVFSKIFELTTFQRAILHLVRGLFALSWATRAPVTIPWMEIQLIFSGVYPAYSAFFASEYLRNKTPIKKLSRKKLPTIMKTT